MKSYKYIVLVCIHHNIIREKCGDKILIFFFVSGIQDREKDEYSLFTLSRIPRFFTELLLHK
jgi:hypothetical protein